MNKAATWNHFLTISSLQLWQIEQNLRYILDTIAESDDEEERWKGVTTLQLLTRNGTGQSWCYITSIPEEDNSNQSMSSL